MSTDRKPISEIEAMEYESGRCGMLMSYVYFWFPLFFIWRFKRKYKRYLGFMEYGRLTREREEKNRKELIELMMKN